MKPGMMGTAIKEMNNMSRKGLIVLIIMMLIAVSSSAETIRIGKTDCLLQPSAETDSMKKYVLFVGSAEYFNARSSCKSIMADDGDLLIPQGNCERELCSAASDEVIRDIRPTLLSWAADGYEMILIGYSAGGYPATTLACSSSSLVSKTPLMILMLPILNPNISQNFLQI